MMEFDSFTGTISDGHQPVAFVNFLAHHNDPARTYAMVAAPELLAALKRLEYETQYLCKQLAARGMPGVSGDTVDVVLLAVRTAIAKATQAALQEMRDAV